MLETEISGKRASGCDLALSEALKGRLSRDEKKTRTVKRVAKSG